MRAKIATNVASEKSPVLRVMPLFVKNIAMKAAFNAVGECKACLCLSNLGVVQVPEVMRPYIERFDFVIGPQANAPHNAALRPGAIRYMSAAYATSKSRSWSCIFTVCSTTSACM